MLDRELFWIIDFSYQHTNRVWTCQTNVEIGQIPVDDFNWIWKTQRYLCTNFELLVMLLSDECNDYLFHLKLSGHRNGKTIASGKIGKHMPGFAQMLHDGLATRTKSRTLPWSTRR